MAAPRPGQSLVLYGMTSGVSARGFIAGQAGFLKDRGWRVALTCSSLGRDTASVLCGDGRVRTTTDGGDKWPTAFTAEGALAFALLPNGRGALAGPADDCDGTRVTALVGGTPKDSTCIKDAEPTPGQVAISVTDGAVWLVAGDTVYTASEAAGRWTKGKGSVRR